MHVYRWISFAGAILLILSLIIGVGCTGGNRHLSSTTSAPHDPFPADDTTGVPVTTMLAWSYPDFDPDSVYFEVYFGAENPPPMVDSMVVDTMYDPGILNLDKTYYWRIIAKPAGERSQTSEVWSFNTYGTFTFPMTIGNTWGYQRSYFVSRVEPDTIDAPWDSSSGYGQTVILRSGYLHDTLEVYCFHVYWMEEDGGWEINRYLNNLPDGLYSFAYEPYHWIAPPKKSLPDGAYIDFHGMRFESVTQMLAAFHSNFKAVHAKKVDSLIYEEHPVREIAYPLEVGDSWIYRDSVFGGPWNMDKAVMGMETVTVPAGTFECFKMQWFWDIDGDGEYDTDIEGYDYTSPIGGVKRYFRIFDITIINELNEIIGTFDVDEVYELTDYELK